MRLETLGAAVIVMVSNAAPLAGQREALPHGIVAVVESTSRAVFFFRNSGEAGIACNEAGGRFSERAGRLTCTRPGGQFRRRALRVSDPHNPEQVARALEGRYPDRR